MMIANVSETPEWMVSPEEGADFMKAAQNVMRHYSVQSTQRTLDWISLFGVAGGMYGTRVAAISIRKRREKTEKPQHDPGVHYMDFGPGGNGHPLNG